MSGGSPTNFAIGSRLAADKNQTYIKVEGPGSARLIALREPTLLDSDSNQPEATRVIAPVVEIPYAQERPREREIKPNQARQTKYPYVHGRGPVDATLACFQMLSQHLGMSFKRDVLKLPPISGAVRYENQS